MAHMALAEDYEDEETTEEVDLVNRHGRGRAVIGTDEYIESQSYQVQPARNPTNMVTEIVGPASDNETDTDVEITDVEITDVKPSIRDNGKLKAGEKVAWSDSDDENAYEKVS